MNRESYVSKKNRLKHMPKDDAGYDYLQRYMRDTLGDTVKYLEWIFYCVLFIAGLGAVLFLRILFEGLFR